jgi:hypothetical protein
MLKAIKNFVEHTGGVLKKFKIGDVIEESEVSSENLSQWKKNGWIAESKADDSENIDEPKKHKGKK